jgi:hypothetical protein
MTAAGKRYLSWLASQPCSVSGEHGVELAHVRGCLSAKTGLMLPRRKGPAYYYVLPLTPELHRLGSRSIHAIGETAFFEEHDVNPHQLVATLFCRYFEEGR